MRLKKIIVCLLVIHIIMITILKYFTFIERNLKEEPNVRLYFTSIPLNYDVYFSGDIDYNSGYYFLLAEDEMELIGEDIYSVIKNWYPFILFVNILFLFIMVLSIYKKRYILINGVFSKKILLCLFVILILMTTILKYFTFIRVYTDGPTVELYYTSIPSNYDIYVFENTEYDWRFYFRLATDENELIGDDIYSVIKNWYPFILFVNILFLFIMVLSIYKKRYILITGAIAEFFRRKR